MERLFKDYNMEQWYEWGLTSTEIGDLYGCVCSTVLKRLTKAGVVRTLSGHRQSNWKGGTRTYFQDEARKIVGLPTDFAYCDGCGKMCSYDVHHKDGTNSNNRRDNLAVLCRRCHRRSHRQ